MQQTFLSLRSYQEKKNKEYLQKEQKLKYKKPLKELISEKKTKKISEKKVRVFIITYLIKQKFYKSVQPIPRFIEDKSS